MMRMNKIKGAVLVGLVSIGTINTLVLWVLLLNPSYLVLTGRVLQALGGRHHHHHRHHQTPPLPEKTEKTEPATTKVTPVTPEVVEAERQYPDWLKPQAFPEPPAFNSENPPPKPIVRAPNGLSEPPVSPDKATELAGTYEASRNALVGLAEAAKGLSEATKFTPMMVVVSKEEEEGNQQH